MQIPIAIKIIEKIKSINLFFNFLKSFVPIKLPITLPIAQIKTIFHSIWPLTKYITELAIHIKSTHISVVACAFFASSFATIESIGTRSSPPPAPKNPLTNPDTIPTPKSSKIKSTFFVFSFTLLDWVFLGIIITKLQIFQINLMLVKKSH